MTKKLTKAQLSAQKAAKTRRARNDLLAVYGCDTYDVLELMSKGKSNVEVELLTSIPMPSVAAYRANFVRHCYDWVLKDCNF